MRDRLPPPERLPRTDWTGVPELAYPARLNCAAPLLDDWIAKGHGDRIALRHADGPWTYARLAESATRIARVLVNDCGLVTGQRVLLRSANQPMLVACWFGVMKAGGIAVSTMPMLRAKELREIIAKADVRLALCDARLAADLDTAMASVPGARVLLFDTTATARPREPRWLPSLMAAASVAPLTVDTAADDPAFIAFTSGTTGRSKGTVHTHRDILAVTDTYGRHVLRPTTDDVFIGSPPIAFTFGLGGLVLFPMRVGASTALVEQASPPNVLDGITTFRATIVFSSPTGYRAMLAHPAPHDLSSLRACVSAGETLPASTFNAWLDRTGIRLMDGIGSTEMLHMFIGSRAEDARPGSTGQVVPGYRARIVDEAGHDVPVGTVGRLAVLGPTGCRYLDDLDNQRRYVQDGWNLTGDAYRVDEQGYFWYQARTDDMIISSGYNISGVEVESVLLTHAAVSECAVVGLPDELRGQIVKAFVVLGAGIDPSDELARELQEHVKREIAPYKYPRAVEFVGALPRTLTGKIQRFRLRQTVRFHEPDGWAAPVGYSNAVSATGRVVCLAGQVGWNPTTCLFESLDFADQVRQALRNVVAALGAAGATPEHLTRMTWYVTNREAYLARRREIGQIYREVVGRHYPAMSLLIVAGLIEPGAEVEIEATAVIP